MINTTQSIREVCELALKHRLYVQGWCLKYELQYPHGLRHARLYYEGDTPIAIGVICHGFDVQIYVRATQRRKGIGRKLVEHLRQEMGATAHHMDAGKGVTGSEQFWKATNVRRWD